MTACRVRGIRGATTVEENSAPAIERAVVELMTRLQDRNGLSPEEIVSVIFTATADLDAMFPSQAARLHLEGWEAVALLDVAQMPVKDSIPRCVRVLVQVNTPRPLHELQHIYLREAMRLRPDRNK